MAQTNDQGDGSQETSGTPTNASTTSNNTTDTAAADSATNVIDKDFDPSAQALIDEIDDERTLEEEEALAGVDSSVVQNELDDLKRESEMPIEELLAHYQRMRSEVGMGAGEEEDFEDDEEEDEDFEDEDVDEDEDDDGEDEDANECRKNEHPQADRLTDVPARQDACSSSTTEQEAASSYGPKKPALKTQFTELPTEEGGGFLFELDKNSDNIFRAIMDQMSPDDSDDSDDYSYSSNDEYDDHRGWRRVIHVGPEHQAEVPDNLSHYENDLPPYENEDVLVWKCNPEQDHDQILDYLKQASVIPKRNDISLTPASVPKFSDHHMRLYRERIQDTSSAPSGLLSAELNHENINNDNSTDNQPDVYMLQSRKRLRIEHEIARDIAMDVINQHPIENVHTDNPVGTTHDKNTNSDTQDNRPELSTDEYFQGEEQLLYLLLQCNHNFKEALRRRTLDPFKYYISEPMSLWSQDECLGFEHGLRTYGKNFRLVRDNKVPTRTRAEVVAFYYLWKKSERHDVYTNQYKIVRKRCLTHPGTTDYMDKFIEDNESALNASSSTPTPTPTESTVENNRQVNTSNDSQPITNCHTSESGTPLTECLNLPGKLSVLNECSDQAGQQHQQPNTDDNTQGNSYYVNSNSPVK